MVAVAVRLARGLPDTGALRQPPEGLGTRAGRRSRPVAPPDVSGPAGHLVGVPHAVDVERLLVSNVLDITAYPCERTWLCKYATFLDSHSGLPISSTFSKIAT